MDSIDFFYDIGSPYSYLCATQIDGVAAKHERAVRWRPMLLGAVFKATGNDMPARVPAKAKWMLQDLALWAESYGVPFTFPPSFPPNTVRAMRACAYTDQKGKAREFSLALFEGYWARGVDPSSPEGITHAASLAGMDGAEVIAATETQPIKDALRATTDAAIAAGVFGAPAILVGDKLFWGNDRLLLLDRVLAGSVGS
ncbi:MAG: 2-hydroxychromene-2-carboxylate isomerase [Polyangiaceae bacterium]|nr:2-hydroxychromene-2-carboxylate isomerase [Polyangiaceae bacterium]